MEFPQDNNFFENNESFTRKIDLGKLFVVLRKSAIFLILIFGLCLSVSYIIIRYSKKVYMSESLLRIEQENKATEFSFARSENKEEKQNRLQEETQLIRSNIIYDKVIDRLNLYISYYVQGEFLDEEKYKASFYSVEEYQIKRSEIFGKKIYFNHINKQKYELNILLSEDNYYNVEGEYGKLIVNEYLNIKINLNDKNTNPSDIKFYFILKEKHSLRGYLNSGLELSANADASTIKVMFSEFTPTKARDIVNAIDSVYLIYTFEEKKRINEQTIAFIEGQLQKTRDLLESSEQEFIAYANENKTLDINQDYNILFNRKNQLILQKNSSSEYVNVLNKIVEIIKNDSSSKTIIPFLSYVGDNDLKSKLVELNEMEVSLIRLKKYTSESSQAIKSKKEKIKFIKEALLIQIQDILDSEIRVIEDFDRELASLNAKFNSIPQTKILQERINRNWSLYQQFFVRLNERKLEYEIAKAGIISQYSIFREASNPSVPILPKSSSIYMTSIMLGVLICFVLVVVMYIFNNTYTSQSELEHKTNVPILGSIPAYKKMEFSRLVVHENPKSSISESFRSLRTNLDFFIEDGVDRKVISVTSTISGEGKTFIAVNLAAIIALSGKKVVLVDMDMRKPKVNLAFERHNIVGMSTILIGRNTIEECIQNTDVESLDFISAGPIPPNPSELIIRDVFNETLEKLKKMYDIVVIDTPPTGLVTDGILLMKKADAPIYVVRANYSKIGFEKNFNNLYKQKEFNKLSIVINGISKLNNYGYGYGYGYGSYYEEDSKKTKKGLLTFWKK